MKIQNTPSETPDSKAPLQKVDPRDAETVKRASKQFSNLMQKKAGPETEVNDSIHQGKKNSDKPKPGSDTQDLARSGQVTGDSILSAFQNRMPDQADISEKQGADTSLSDIARRISDRILVSDSQLSSRQEVRISLKNTVLKDTEIIISKEGTTTRINLVTGANDTFQFLTENKASLVNHLNDRLSTAVSVSVSQADTSGGQSDGRSRQQRDLYSELEDEQ